MSMFVSDLSWKKKLYQRIYILRLIPVLIAVSCHPARKIIEADLARWQQIRQIRGTSKQALVYFLTFSPEFRYLVYWRLGGVGYLLNVFAPGLRTLHLLMSPSRVGPGLYIQHGESTFVHCHRIGRNAWINQGVTIGYTSNTDCPTLGDNVRISTGAKVLGNVTLGNNVTVGPNAVVLRAVPDGATVSPPASRILKSAVETRPSHARASSEPLLSEGAPMVALDK